ncbi:NADH-quinone oxidoreductase subunit C [Acidocella sp.]|uniref:hydrogenase large subunit n=1 Tax=Acidocella sp. TaxID=50710 RepID=UPI00262921A7|nr:NADH-quinone oxidoreductase subunit C [Acidocella sp.]
MTAVDLQTWEKKAAEIGQGLSRFVAIWGDASGYCPFVHLATRRKGASSAEVINLAAPDRRFPSIGAHQPAAILMERAIFDMHGLIADGLPDTRPWLDHGTWPGSRATKPYKFKPVNGDGIHQIPVGPVHAGTIEPGHFRFSVNGETIVRIEARLGYTHKGTLKLMRRASIDHAAKLTARISGDSTCAYSFAFALAVEQALGVEAPARAQILRGVMAELERLANHLGDFGAICNDAGFPLLNAHGAMLRERMLRLCAACFGHRLMMDLIVPGGVTADLAHGDEAKIDRELTIVSTQFERIVEVYEKTASLQDRTVGTGRLDPAVAELLGCGGYVGRASGQTFDARRDMAYAPYHDLHFGVPCRDIGDADTRVRVRIEEVRQSSAIILALLRELPDGPIQSPRPPSTSPREGNAIVEGFRGDVFSYVRISNGCIEDVFLRDPSWFLWPALETAIEGNIVADFPLCNKSFNASYSGCDL